MPKQPPVIYMQVMTCTILLEYNTELFAQLSAGDIVQIANSAVCIYQGSTTRLEGTDKTDEFSGIFFCRACYIYYIYNEKTDLGLP